MIRVPDIGTADERFAKITQSINSSPILLSASVVDGVTAITTTAASLGGIAVDRSWLRKLAPDTRWVARAYGLVDPADANGVTIYCEYVSDAIALTTLGSITPTGAGYQKASMGPFDVFGTGGVPAGETIPIVRLRAQKVTSGSANLAQWTLWLELRAPA